MAAPAGALRARPRPRQPPRQHWKRRLVAGLIIFLSLAVVGTGMVYVYVRVQLGKIKKVSAPSLVGDAEGQVMNVLLVGSDTRSTVGKELADVTGKSEEGDRSGLSDTMMILHVDPRNEQAAILSIPRDLWLPIARGNGRDRINSAFAIGGPDLLIQTIRESLGITVNHYAEVDFEGFRRIVETVGGLRIYLDAPARDLNSGLDLPDAGCVTLDGYQALAYVRSRYYESYEAGRWVADQSSDFGRIQRQQDFIRRMMKKAVSQGLTNPLTLNRLISIGVNNLTIDKTMSTKDMVSVARRFRSLDPDSVDMQTLPTTPYTTPGGADVLLLNQAEAQPLIDRINGKAPLAPAAIRPSDVQVRILNGNGADGAASKAALALQGAGFTVIGSGDADSFGYQHTVIRYAPGKTGKAELVRSYLAGGATLQEDTALGTADLALIVGADYTGVRPGPANTDGTAAGPSTTAAPQNPAPDARGSKQPAC